ncbi:MAG: hypothetical protein GY925_06985, partial [Actinomycetia bacterium]|nr:hypothetical protein [Actinomycetes bacterium]
MTSPPLASTGPGGRHYTLPGPNPKHDYMSVTTIIDRGKPKNLGGWYKKTTAEYAYDHRPRWEGLDRPAAVKLITAQADRIRDTAAARGDEAHQHLEARLNGQHPDRLLYTPTTLHYIDAVDQFIDEWAPRPVLVEATVYNHEHRYAGSLDLIADLPELGRTLIDAKTSARVYDEAAWQLAAYRHA